jgi:ADP-ribosyl-[dinitrogen reductase] hydrolase
LFGKRRPGGSDAGRIYLISHLPLAEIAQTLGSSGFVAETVPLALEVARRIRDAGFETALYALNDAGGDTDTIGSIAGQIAGAAGVALPTELLLSIPGSDDLQTIASLFAARVAESG